MRSTKRRPSAQVDSRPPSQPVYYIATSGTELVDTSYTLVFIEQAALGYVRLNGEDLAVWIVEEGHPPRLVSFVRALAQGGALLQSV